MTNDGWDEGNIIEDLSQFIGEIKEAIPTMSPALLRQNDIYPWLWSLKDQLRNAISEAQAKETTKDIESE